MIRWLALAAAALLCGCVFTSERPLYGADDGVRLFANDARFEWRENGRENDKRTVVMRLRGDKYDIEMVGEDEPLRGAVFVPVRGTREDDYIIQLHITSEVEQPAYAFMWAIDGGYRVVAAPSQVDDTLAGERAMAAECTARPNGECHVTSARALERIYRAGVYPRYVSGGEAPGDYIDLVAEARGETP